MMIVRHQPSTVADRYRRDDLQTAPLRREGAGEAMTEEGGNHGIGATAVMTDTCGTRETGGTLGTTGTGGGGTERGVAATTAGLLIVLFPQVCRGLINWQYVKS